MMIRWVALFGLVFCASGVARAQGASGLGDVLGSYQTCLARVAGDPAFATLAAAGFFSGAAAGGPDAITPAQAALLARARAAQAGCQVGLRTGLDNVDTGLADAAAQARQLGDVNDLLLYGRAESWAAYRRNQRRIEGDFWRAAARPVAPAQADDDGMDEMLN